MVIESSVSVIINAYNEEDNISDCLDSLVEQTYDDFELVVIDDGSTDDTVEIVESYIDKFQLKIYKVPHVGLRKARRIGFSKAKGEILVNIDADEVLREDFLHNIVKPFKIDEEIGGVGGMVIADGSSWAAEAYGVWNEIFFELRVRGEEVDWIEGGCSAFRREAYEEIGGFTKNKISSDKDISWRLKDSGWKLISKKDVVAYQKEPSTFSSVIKREHKHGRKEFYLLKRHEDKMSWKELTRFYPFFGLLVLGLSLLYVPLLLLVLTGAFVTYLGVFYLVRKYVEDAKLGTSVKSWVIFTFINLAWSIGYFKSALGIKSEGFEV